MTNFNDLTLFVTRLIEKTLKYDIQEGSVASAKDGIAWVKISGAAKSQLATYPSIMTPSPNDDCLLIRSRLSQQWRMISWYGKPSNGTQVATSDWRKNIQLAPPSGLQAAGYQNFVLFSWSAPPQEFVVFEIQTALESDKSDAIVQPIIIGGNAYVYSYTIGTVYARVRSVNINFKRSSWSEWTSAAALNSYTLTTRESDGIPTVYGTREIIFGGGTLVDNGSGTVTWTPPAGSTIQVEEIDGSPSVAATLIQFPNGTVTNPGGAGTARYTPVSLVNVREADSSPSYSNVVDLVLPNGTLSSGGAGVAVYTPATPTILVQEVDTSPSVTTTVLEFPNGTLTNPSAGVARYTPAATGNSVIIEELDGTPSDVAETIVFDGAIVSFVGTTATITIAHSNIEKWVIDTAIVVNTNERLVYHDFILIDIGGSIVLNDNAILLIA